jgi:hypothetical protein
MKRLTGSAFGVMEMSAKEMGELNGGIDWGKFLKGGGLVDLATEVVEHWSEIKVGFGSGYNAKI